MLKIIEREAVRSYYMLRRVAVMYERATQYLKTEPSGINMSDRSLEFRANANDVQSY